MGDCSTRWMWSIVADPVPMPQPHYCSIVLPTTNYQHHSQQTQHVSSPLHHILSTDWLSRSSLHRITESLQSFVDCCNCSKFLHCILPTTLWCRCKEYEFIDMTIYDAVYSSCCGMMACMIMNDVPQWCSTTTGKIWVFSSLQNFKENGTAKILPGWEMSEKMLSENKKKLTNQLKIQRNNGLA